MASKKLLVAAIDFGTTFSGYAFSLSSDPDKIIINKSWGASLGFQSYKAPTSVLVDTSGEFKAFGYEAEQTYSQALEEENGDGHNLLLFRHFKMMLHNNKELKLSAAISSVDGTLRPAIDIFSHAMRYLKDHMLDAIELSSGVRPKEDEVTWVITVPAIWEDSAKDFMRMVAYKAGCINEKNSDNLVIALEPEAASLCCRKPSLAQFNIGNSANFSTGTKYLVLDCGGGTVDITAHLVEQSGKIKEIVGASGGPWGGTNVDKGFVNLIEDVLGKHFLNTYRSRSPQEWLRLLGQFESAKKDFKPDQNSKVSLSMPWGIGNIYAETNAGKRIDKVLKEASGINFENGMIIILYERMKEMFEPVARNITSHLRDLLNKPELRDLRYVLMVGGFSESVYLQQAVKETCPRQNLTVMVPCESQLAIVRGAVAFGQDTGVITQRVLRRTYGTDVNYTFDPRIHDLRKRKVTDVGHTVCTDVFRLMVEKGQIVSETFTITDRRIIDSKTEVVNIYSCDTKTSGKLLYVDNPQFRHIGKAVIHNCKLGSPFEVTMRFGQTELKVDVIEVATGRKAQTEIQLMMA